MTAPTGTQTGGDIIHPPLLGELPERVAILAPRLLEGRHGRLELRVEGREPDALVLDVALRQVAIAALA